MGKAVLISIRPEWVEKIVRNEKTVEVRKTRPKLDTPFKCYIYCTQGNDARRLRGSWGKVIGEFICDRVETIKAATDCGRIYLMRGMLHLRTQGRQYRLAPPDGGRGIRRGLPEIPILPLRCKNGFGGGYL